MSVRNSENFAFEQFVLAPRERLLLRDGKPTDLTPKAFDLLLVLVRNRGHLVSKDQLLQEVWPDSYVEEVNLTVNISALRKTLGEEHSATKFIETVPKRGYRFVASVRPIPDTALEILLNRVSTVGVNPSRTESGLNRSSESDAEFETVNRSGINSLTQSASRLRRQRLTYLLIPVALGALLITSFGFIHRWRSSGVDARAAAFFHLGRSQILTTGKAIEVAIAPAGNQVAYVKEDAQGQSLWLRQVSIDSEIELLSPQQSVRYTQVAYSRDGNAIFYLVDNREAGLTTLNEIPVLGGVPRKIFENVNSAFALSQHGKQVAFFRDNEKAGEQYLILGQTDGTGERAVATNRLPAHWWGPMGPVWAPDDQRVACLLLNQGQNDGKFVVVPTDGGGMEDLTPSEWKLAFGGEWTRDGLVISAQRKGEEQWQLWQINANGEARRLTNDWPKYYSLSLAANKTSLATIQKVSLMNLWLVSISVQTEPRQITEGAGIYFDVSITPDNRLLYSSYSGSIADIWRMDLEGSNRQQLTRDSGSNYSPVATSDGRYLLFHSNRSGTYYLYRTLSDGSQAQRLTSEMDEEATADISPDSTTVVFAFGALKRVPIEGGAAVVLNNKLNHTPVIAPEGKLVATWYTDDPANGQRIALFPIDKAGDPLRVFQVPTKQRFGDRIRWTADGRGLLYIHTQDGVSNIWLQPVDGSPPRQITNFQSETIFSFAVSRDGKNLVCVRGTEANDVVIFNVE